MRFIFILAILLCGVCNAAFSVSVYGFIYDNEGKPLPYATIYLKETGSGTVANSDGYYELKLQPGQYQLVFQFVGYQSQVKEVVVTDIKQELNVQLQPQALVLKEVNIKAGKEDPAYAIMRRAISKAGFHLNQVDTFSARVYIKGAGQVTSIPFFLKGRLKKEGVDTSRLFISESLSEITFKRPNTFSQRVISVRSSGDDNNTDPNVYIFTSFYNPEIAGAVTPFSPRAFAYYRFSYEGTFNDRGYEVSRIKVTPRSKGDNVFEGYLQIVENQWSIHSLNLEGIKLGITFQINQMYAPVQEGIWLPVSHQIKFFGSVLGVGFEYKYLASVSDYFLEVNPDLDYELSVIDEKTDPEKADEVSKTIKKEEVEKLEELAATKEVNRKQLRKLVKVYEKMEKEQEKQPEVVSRSYFKVDSTAYKMDSSYWENIRPIPLNSKEREGYQQVDSVAEINRLMAEGDTLRASKSRKGFQWTDIITGDSYKLAEKTYLEISNPLRLVQFNTVDGWNAEYAASFSKTRGENNNFFKISPRARYAFARKKISGKAAVQYEFGEGSYRNNLSLSGGRYIRQFNPQEPIHPVVNTLMTLLLEQNYMKLYERDFLAFSFNKKLGDKVNLRLSTEWAERHELENNSDYKIINRDAVEGYLPNMPFSLELSDTGFPTHEAATFQFDLSVEPWVKYRVRNDRKIKINNSSPVFKIMYKAARPFGKTVIDYDLVQVGGRHVFKNGVRGKLDLSVEAGKFLNKENMHFMDYKHFPGNRTPIITHDPLASFRLLDYYLHSTNEEFVMAHAQYQFRKLLATQFTVFRMMGLRESLMVNYLAAPTALNYMELGYSFDYVMRIFRVEAVSSFREGKYEDFGVRIGVVLELL